MTIMKDKINSELLTKITNAWENVELPIGSKTYLTLSEEDLYEARNSNSLSWGGDEDCVEWYFQDKSWDKIEPYNKITRYLPLPLHYMNDPAALYYSQCYLRYFVKHVDEIETCDYGYIEQSFKYFRQYDNELQLSEGKFHKLQNVTDEQVKAVEEVTNYILPYINLAYILIGSYKNVEPIETINTSYKKITALHKKIAATEKIKTSESAESQINYYKRIIGLYESIIASYENIFTTKKK